MYSLSQESMAADVSGSWASVTLLILKKGVVIEYFLSSLLFLFQKLGFISSKLGTVFFRKYYQNIICDPATSGFGYKDTNCQYNQFIAAFNLYIIIRLLL